MLRIFGNMQLAQVAGTKEEIEGLKMTAKRQGSDLLIEDGNYLYARAIFMGYDLPNGNGDAIPSIYAGSFGPSFIGKHVDVNHQLDPESIIGTIMATWHVQKPLVAGDGPRVIGRNAFGRDIDGRPRVFGFAPAVDAEPMELQLEGIFRLDRSTRAGDIMARKLIAKEIDSVSQEASTAYCLCPVCAHKVSMPFDMPCDHLMHGSLMLKAYKVAGYDQEVLAYKIHHDPSGTGLGCVGVPAYDKAKLAELTAMLKTGGLTVEAFQKLLAEQELVWGRTPLVIQASHDLKLIAADLSKKPVSAPSYSAPASHDQAPPASTATKPKMAANLESMAPVEGDTKEILARKLSSVAAAQGRLNRESLSLTRHVFMASAWPGSAIEGSLDLLAERVCAVAEVQALLDTTRKALLAAGDVKIEPGAADSVILAFMTTGSVASLGSAIAVGFNGQPVLAAKYQIDGFMPAVRSFQAALKSMDIEGAAAASEALIASDTLYADFTKKFDAWKEAAFDKVMAAGPVMTSFKAFKTSFDTFVNAQSTLPMFTPLTKAGIKTVAEAVDAQYQLSGMATSPRRLRMRAGTLDLVAAFRGGKSDERARAVVGAFLASTGEWTWASENYAVNWSAGKFQPKDSTEASKIVNGLAQVIYAMGKKHFEGGMDDFAAERLIEARRQMTMLAADERLQAGRRVVSKIWMKALALNPSFHIEKSAPRVLAESKTWLTAELVTEIGKQVQTAGGPWPWTAEKAVSWNEFVASKTDEELSAICDGWYDRVKAEKDELAKLVIGQNISKLQAQIEDRGKAKGVVAKFFRKPVLADSHWTLFDAEGKPVGRVDISVAAAGPLDRKVKMGDREVYLASWLQSDQYGRDLVENARKLGLEATLRFFVKADRQPIASYGQEYPEDASVDEQMKENPEWVEKVKLSVAKDMMSEMDDPDWDPSNADDVASFVESNADNKRLNKLVRDYITSQMAQDMSEMGWDDLLAALDGLMKRFGTTNWQAQGKNMGWQNRSGEKTFEAADAKEFLDQILPKTDVTIELYDDKDSIGLRVSHHDAPTGETYTITPAPQEAEVEASKKLKAELPRHDKEHVEVVKELGTLEKAVAKHALDDTEKPAEVAKAIEAKVKLAAEFGLKPAYGRLKHLGDFGYLTLEDVEDPGDSAPGGMNARDWAIYRSNFLAATKLLPEGGSEGQADFIQKHPDEEYPGDVVYEMDFINVYQGAASAMAKATKIVDDLNNYPVLDESIQTDLETEAMNSEINSWAMDEAKAMLGYDKDWAELMTDEEAGWLVDLANSDPKRHAEVQKTIDSIFELTGDKEQLMRRAVEEGLNYGDWTVVHMEPMVEQLNSTPEGKTLVDPAETMHQFIKSQMRTSEPGTKEYQEEAEKAGQLRLLESLNAASLVVAGQLELRAMIASDELAVESQTMASVVANLVGGHEAEISPKRVPGQGAAFFTYPLNGHLMVAVLTNYADGSWATAWAPISMFASVSEAAENLSGKAMASFEAGAKFDDVASAIRVIGSKVEGAKEFDSWMKAQGYVSHVGPNLLCQASRSRMGFWAKTPKGYEPVVKELKRQKNVDNPWAVAWSMKNRGIRPKASKIKADEFSKGRFTVTQMVENGPWYVVEMGPENRMVPFYGPYEDEETAKSKLEHGMEV